MIAWGGLNAVAPSANAAQVAFQLDYTGGYKKYFKNNPVAQALAALYRRGSNGSSVVQKLRQLQQTADMYWKTAFNGGCGTYDGPLLALRAVITCKAGDGSYWAVQEWQRELPDYGAAPTAAESAWELRLSHWTGPLPVLEVHTDWAYQEWDHLYGTLTYLGQPVFGFHSTKVGNPLDAYGRNIYVDTLDSRYGSGWHRENSALTHSGTGVFCYAFAPHGAAPAGNGSRYRITVIGPGVTPDVSWEGPAPGPYDAQADAIANEKIAALHDKICQPN